MNNFARELSDEELLKDTERLASEERRIISWMLENLREIERRKLYADKGYGSLFLYCVKVLKYSEPSAQRRIDAMRLSRDLPEVREKVKSGEMSLSVASQLQSFFRREAKAQMPIATSEKQKILNQVLGKSSRETERELLSLSSQPEIHYQEKVRPVTPELSEIRFAANPSQMALFEKARGLLAHTSPNLSWAELFEKVTELALQALDPARKPRRSVSPTRKKMEEGRTPSAALSREVWQRDQGKCRVCRSSYGLEIDHINPWALGGPTTLENLRLLCRNCNQRKAIRCFGLKKIEAHSRRKQRP
jgi:hypothetical protein